MILGISEALDNALVQLVIATVAVLGTANLWYLSRIKKDTTGTNIAVNHRSEGELTISRQVDQSASDIVELKYDMNHMKNDIGELKIGMNNVQGAVENLLQSHVMNKAKLDEVLKAMPKRKTDRGEDGPS